MRRRLTTLDRWICVGQAVSVLLCTASAMPWLLSGHGWRWAVFDLSIAAVQTMLLVTRLRLARRKMFPGEIAEVFD